MGTYVFANQKGGVGKTTIALGVLEKDKVSKPPRPSTKSVP